MTPLFFLIVIYGCASTGIHFNPLFFPEIKLQPQKESKTPFLGIYMGKVPEKNLSETTARERVVYVDHVMAETEAEKAGILAGDIIIAVDDKAFSDDKSKPWGQLSKTIKNKNIGDPLKLSIIRDGKPMIIEAKTGEMKNIPARVKPHPEIDALQISLDKADSEIYNNIQIDGRLEDFANTMAGLREKSLLLDSYKVAPDNPFRLSEINYLLQNPTNIIPVSRGITKSILDYFKFDVYNLSRLIQEVSRSLDVNFELDIFEPPTIKTVEDFTGYVVETLDRAESYRKAAFKELSEEEMSFLEERSLSILTEGYSTPENQERMLRLLKTAKKVNYRMLFKSMAEASRIVSPEIIQALVDAEVKYLKKYPDIPTDLADGDVIVVIDTHSGKIIIGGPGDTHYKGNAFAIIDLGGNDLYENNAGASTPKNPFCIVVDLSGNDKYITKGDLAQGTGFMGTGILADFKGNDTYISEGFSQGAGIFGGGILLDLDGDDIFTGGSSIEGAGIFGIGMLLNAKGNDTYEAHSSSQGFASVKGFGALVDLSGDDSYFAGGKYPDHRDPDHATTSLSQGFAIGMRPYYDSPVGASGGIGVLIDKEGADSYIGDYFSQGSSYWYSLGILQDMKGDDTYIAGRYSQGAGVHISAGLIIDEGGDDSYIVTYGVSQGMGHDFGIGVLADFYGDDIYIGGILVQGAATCGSLGVLYDEDGIDYFTTRDGTQDTEDQEESCNTKGFGILMNDKTDENL